MDPHAAMFRRLLTVFSAEAAERIQRVNAALLALERGDEDLDAAEALTGIMRELHTLKGAGGSVNLEDVETLSHDLESVFGPIQRGERGLSDAVFAVAYRTSMRSGRSSRRPSRSVLRRWTSPRWSRSCVRRPTGSRRRERLRRRPKRRRRSQGRSNTRSWRPRDRESRPTNRSRHRSPHSPTRSKATSKRPRPRSPRRPMTRPTTSITRICCARSRSCRTNPFADEFAALSELANDGHVLRIARCDGGGACVASQSSPPRPWTRSMASRSRARPRTTLRRRPWPNPRRWAADPSPTPTSSPSSRRTRPTPSPARWSRIRSRRPSPSRSRTRRRHTGSPAEPEPRARPGRIE